MIQSKRKLCEIILWTILTVSAWGMASSAKPVSIEPLQFKPEFLGVCDNTTANLYDVEGKIIDEMIFPQLTSDSGSKEHFRAFVFKIPKTNQKTHFIPPRMLPISHDKSKETYFMAGPMFLDSYSDHNRLIIQGSLRKSYNDSSLFGLLNNKAPVDEVDFKLRYYYGPKNKAHFTINGPFETGKAYTDNNNSYSIRITEKNGWTGYKSKLNVQITAPLSMKKDTPIVFYDKLGKRYVVCDFPHDRRSRTESGNKSIHEFELVNLPISQIESIAAEIPYVCKFENIKTLFKDKSCKDQSFDRRFMIETMASGVENVNENDKQRLLKIAEKWIKSDSAYQKLTAARIGLAFKQQEFVNTALDILSGDYKETYGYSIDDGRYSAEIDLDSTTYQCKMALARNLKKITNLNTQQLQKLKKAIFKAETNYYLQNLFNILWANPQDLEIVKELAANERQAIWTEAVEIWHYHDPNNLKPFTQWPIEFQKRLILCISNDMGMDIAKQAYEIIPNLLDANFLYMQPGEYKSFRNRMIRSMGRRTATQSDIKLLRELTDDSVLYRFRERYGHSYFDRLLRTVTVIATNFNSWYDIDLGGLGSEVPWMGDYGDKEPRNAEELKTLIDEVLEWYISNPDAKLTDLTITGKVLDKSGKLVPSADLEFICHERTSVQGRKRVKAGAIKTDQDGSFVFKNAKSGHNYSVAVFATGYKAREGHGTIHVSWTNAGTYRIEDNMNLKKGEHRTNDIILIEERKSQND